MEDTSKCQESVGLEAIVYDIECIQLLKYDGGSFVTLYEFSIQSSFEISIIMKDTSICQESNGFKTIVYDTGCPVVQVS